MTRFDLVTVAAVAAAVVLAGAASLALVAGVALTPADPSFAPDPWTTPAPSMGREGEHGGELVVDIEGGVNLPGIHRLPAGSRVADALAAAGGYADGADLASAARSLNLAAAGSSA